MTPQENSNQIEDLEKTQRVRQSTLALMTELKLKGENFDTKVKGALHELQKIRKKLGQRTVGALATEEDKKGMARRIAVYPGHCFKCKRNVDAGEPILWSPGKVMCLECSVDAKSDKGLADKFLIVRELNNTIRVLQNRANQLADFINEGRDTKKYYDLQRDVAQLVAMGQKYLYEIADSNDPIVPKMVAFLEKVEKEFNELRVAVTTRFEMVKKKKKVRKYT